MKPLACPFPHCGSERVELVCCASQWFVDCLECGATGPSVTDGDKDDSTKAVEQWNAVPRQSAQPNTSVPQAGLMLDQMRDASEAWYEQNRNRSDD